MRGRNSPPALRTLGADYAPRVNSLMLPPLAVTYVHLTCYSYLYHAARQEVGLAQHIELL